MTTTPSPEPLAPDAAASPEEWWICRTCAVEHAERPDVCAICADERQWVPASGQAWTTLAELAAAGERLVLEELEPDLFGLSSEPSVGIGQQAKIVRTPAGNLLWDPPGYVDDDAVARVRALGPVVAIAASHPHMFGVQVAWSRALGDVPVLVAEADAHWVARPDPVIETWTGEREVLPGVVLSQPGGHFPGSAVVHWAAGAEGRGVLLSGDTIFANPDRTSVSFMRSYPNRIPLSAAVVLRVAEHVARRPFERLYNNFEGVVPADAREVVLRSAQRHAAWVRGDFDHLT
ncbi:MBL fold metallo-hydrolase [Cellulosimicrobium protaetiae]|uniref:MBL fold metallo-hydrolase n=1 Tax=Cellulosimicrobium protaetiae TaxID=2587808 RepID=A0A6M5UD36_9MICO|nr:MBL fold metallo-hydrolase [Cellulosimicrobium protaetiae]QJW35083.1 MBL fold metallo-hydrolase [Cellulosimicrobium protaetiae]